MTAIQVYAMLNKKFNGLISGVDHVDVEGTTLIFYFTDGSDARMTFPDPVGIEDLKITYIDKKPHLICILTDDTEIDAGILPSGNSSGVWIGSTPPPDESYNVWINPDEPGGGGAGTFTGVAGLTVGGIKEGEVFENEPIENVIAKLLSPPYTKPKITIGINPITVLYDVEDDTLDKLTIVANVTKTTEEIKYIKFYVESKLVETLNDAEKIKDGGVFKSAQTFDPPIKETFTVKVEACDVDTESIVTASTKIKFIGKTYYGFVPEGTTIDEDAIRGLSSLLKDSKGYTYDGITTSGTDLYHIVFAQPAVYGSISSITDAMNFEYIQDYTSTTMTFGEGDDAIEYNVVYLTDPASVTDFTQKFS